MIYKVQLGEFDYSEVEYDRQDKAISIHLAQGYYQDGLSEVQYNHFTNLLLLKEDCEEFIRALQLALSDSRKIF